MLLVSNLHGKAYLGSNDSLVPIDEFPQMKVLIDYEFYIGKNEVTCAEYNELSENKIICEKETFPATNVTYFDAVLFANERSKKENFDTAYTYSSKKI